MSICNERRYGYIIPQNEVPSNVTWEHEPLKIAISLNNDSEDDKPIYMIAKSEEGYRDCYGDFDYGYCPLSKYATNSNMVLSKTLPKKSHGYGCAGYRNHDDGAGRPVLPGLWQSAPGS